MHANARRLIEVAGGSRLWAVVKADGYGHGAVECAGAALSAGAERVCCATLEEARELREALGADVPIVVLSPLEPGEEAEAGGFEIVVSSLEDYARLRAAGVACDVHVKADTGMGRWGMAPVDALAVGRELAGGSGPLRLAGLMSHLATADDDDPAFAAVQTAVFADAGARVPALPAPPRQLGRRARRCPRRASTPCAAASRSTACRRSSDDPAEHGLLPALRWTSRVAGLRELAPGQSAGYGRRLIAERRRSASRTCRWATPTATRGSRAGAPTCSCAARRRPVAATVSMDQLTCVVDEDVQLGDEVVLIGAQGASASRPRSWPGTRETIGYEIVCGDRSGGAPRPARYVLRDGVSVIRDDGAVRLRRQAALVPGRESAGHVVGIEADRAERLGDHRRRARHRGT